MKYYYFLITTILLLIGNKIISQERKFHIGASIGINGTQIDGDGYGGWNKAGLILGGFVTFNYSKKWSLNFRTQYSQKGSRDPSDLDNKKYSFYLIRLNYIEFPIFLQRKFNNFTFDGGFIYGFLINSYEKNENGIISPEKTILEFKKTELSYSIGLKYKLSTRFSVTSRYSQSITPISDKFRLIAARYGLFGGAYNMCLSFGLEYSIL